MWLLFLAGLTTGFHCISMCGNLVIGYSLRLNKDLTWKNHFVYNLSRILSYTFTGFLLGFLGKAINLAAFGGTASIAAGVFMVFLGLKLLGVIKPGLLPKLPGTSFINNLLFNLTGKIRAFSKNTKIKYFPEAALGSITGFMPCGPLQAAQIYAAGTGSPVKGALAMFIFGLGTMPLLFSYGAIAGKLSHAFKNKLAVISAVIVIALGLVMLNRGLTLTGAPVNAAKLKGLIVSYFQGEGGAASSTVKMRIENVNYVPSVIRVPANEPSKLIIFRNEDNVCSDEIVFPDIGVRKPLKPFAETVVELPPLSPGVYQFTCQMGMMSGTLIVGEGSGNFNLYLGIFLVMVGTFGLWYSLNGSKEAPVNSKTKKRNKKGRRLS